ncbi:grpb/dephospho-CoA kinase [Phaeosphaeria sp. MPI-PUGE-AT-0046c]|nr:grpb/dephospho-CoA kinase [Phaeosphaeria sp. MPI-PUGE-AT-0046c]
MRIQIIEFDPSWPQAFSRIKQSLTSILDDIPILSIEHVGSTAVPGMASKPIIDIDIIVDPRNLPETCSALSTNGYTYNPEPRGIDRMSFRYNKHVHDSGATRQTEDGDIRRAVYVNMPEGVALKNHLAVRGVLMKHPELVAEYSRVKRELAAREFESIGMYVQGKNAVLEKILARVDLGEEEWNAIRHFNGL